MLVVRATKKLLRSAGPPTAAISEQSTTLLGSWYATVLFWRPQVALLVNESTLLPLLMPLAPARTLPVRIPEQIARVLAAHQTPEAVIEKEVRHMRECRFGATANRSVVGILNEFAFLAGVRHDDDPGVHLHDLSVQLAKTPCGPLYDRNISPDRELAATLRSAST